MTFTAHACLGAGVTGLATKILFGDPTPGVVAGAILGSLPDTLDWLLWKTDWIERWSLYVWFHHGCPLWARIVFFPIGLHIYLDSFIHLYPGFNWWPRFWYLEVGMWLVGGGLITLAYL